MSATLITPDINLSKNVGSEIVLNSYLFISELSRGHQLLTVIKNRRNSEISENLNH